VSRKRPSAILRVPVKGRIAGQQIDTFADSEIARSYVEHYLVNDRTACAHWDTIDEIHRNTGQEITREYLQRLADEHSPDFATLLLAHRLSSNPINRDLQSRYAREVASLQRPEGDTDHAEFSSDSYLVVFVPGFNYRSYPETGADFARPRAMLDRIGIRNCLLNTHEGGSIEANAELIVEALGNVAAEDNVIVVSASKAGAETALALGGPDARRTARQVRAWVNICGMLHGTPRADAVLRSPLWRLFFKAYFRLKGWDFANVESLATERSRGRMQKLNVPDHLCVVNFVGFPLSGDVTKLARPKYKQLRQHGPNDGLTLLIDEIFPMGTTIVEMGKDHYFRGADVELKTVALVRTVIGECRGRAACETGGNGHRSRQLAN
jgi:hypothetical protein